MLGSLLAFTALNAVGGGWYGLAGAEGVPTTWLEGSPFTSYVVPSVVLLVVIGGTTLTASILVFRQPGYARIGAFGAGLPLIVWIVAQVAIIGMVSWLQPAVALTGLVIVLLARRLP